MGALDRAQRALSNAPLLAKGDSHQQNLGPAKEREARSSTGAALQVLFRPPRPLQPAPVHPRPQGMCGGCTDLLVAGYTRQISRARPSCRVQLPGTAGLRAVRAAPPAPPSLRLLARCTQ